MFQLTIDIYPTDVAHDAAYTTLQHMSTDTLKDIFMLGYTLYQHRVSNVIEDIIRSNMDSEIRARYNNDIQQLKSENIELVKELEEKQHMLLTRHTLDIEKKNMRIEQLERIVRETESKLSTLYDDIYKDGIDKLKEQLKERDMQLQMLRSTNAAKGIIGETLIMDSLRSVFETAEIQYTGKTAHSCDIHMKCFPSEHTYMFESKYKGCVTKADVVKFQQDVMASATSVKGGMFVSILSKNIPEKGSFHFETIKQQTCTNQTSSGCDTKLVLYVAYEDEAEFHMLFKCHCKLFVDICTLYASQAASQSDHDTYTNILETLEQDIVFLTDILKKNRRRIEDFRSKCIRFCGEVEDDNDTLLKRIQNTASLLSLNMKRASIVEQQTQGAITCGTCGKTCKSQRGLKMHRCQG